MITFLNLNIQGFGSIANNFTLNLNQGCIVIIRARNGSGKSTLFSALVWAMYGKNLKGVSEVNTWKKLQPKDYKGTKVELFFQRDGSVFKIVRCQKYLANLDDGAKGKDRLLFYKNGELVSIKGKANLQDRINKELGFSYNLFMNSVMFGQGIKRLIQETNADKKKIFEEVFDLDFINQAKELAIDYKSKISDEVSELNHEKNNYAIELETTKETYDELKAKEKSFDDDLKAEKDEYLQDKARFTTKLNKLKKEYDLEELRSLLTKKVNLERELYSLKQSYSSARKISNMPLEEVINQIYELVVGKKYKKVLKLAKELKEAFSDITKLEDNISGVTEELEGVKETLDTFKAKEKAMDDLMSDINYIDESLSKLKKKRKANVSVLPKYKKRIKKLEGKVSKVETEIDSRENELGDYTWVINDPLGNNGIKAYLFDSSLNLINEALERYSDILGFHIEFSIDLNSTRKDFVTLIEREGTIIDYDELSGGEKQLCNIAMAFAMNETLTSSKGINMAFLDEVFESLSQDNIEIIVSLVKQVFQNKTLFLITHHESLPFSNSKTLQVEKVRGLSNYKVL